MSNPVCSVHGCCFEAHIRGVCKKHYHKLWKYGDPLAGAPLRDPTLTLEQRFRAGFDVAGPDECWEWKKGRHKFGYGLISVNHRSVNAAIVSLEFHLGRKLSPGMWALHSCDNPPCVNPAHLFEGTHSDNMKDAASKHRLALQQPGRIQRARGEDHHHHKLTAEKVTEIRRLSLAGLTQKKIAKQFGVTQPSIGYIVRREQWAHVP